MGVECPVFMDRDKELSHCGEIRLVTGRVDALLDIVSDFSSRRGNHSETDASITGTRHLSATTFTMKNKSELKKIFLILFDISGYTRFMQMHRDQVVHAEEIVVELLSSIISSAKAPMTLYEISGDSVSFYVDSDKHSGIANEIWSQVNLIFSMFRKRAAELALESSLLLCKTCAQTPHLELKAVVHHCEAVFSRVHGFPKIAGPDVILAHRLLKNSVDAREYVIATSGFYLMTSMSLPRGARWQGENCDGFGEIGVLVCYPRPRFFPEATNAA